MRCEELHLHAENLSRRVWELLMLLPTCPKMLQAFQNISDDTVSHYNNLHGRIRKEQILVSIPQNRRENVFLQLTFRTNIQ